MARDLARDPELRKRTQLIARGKASTPAVASFFQVDQEKKSRARRAKVRAIDHRVRGKKAQKAERDKDKKEAVEGKRQEEITPGASIRSQEGAEADQLEQVYNNERCCS